MLNWCVTGVIVADGEPVLAQDGVDVEEVVRNGADQPVHLTVVKYPHPASRVMTINEFYTGMLQLYWV